MRPRPGLPVPSPWNGLAELIFDRAPLPVALDPDVASTQPVAQREQGGSFPDTTLRAARLGGAQHLIAPGRAGKTGWQALSPSDPDPDCQTATPLRSWL